MGFTGRTTAFLAIVAKSLASGLGYAMTATVPGSKEIVHPILFDPYATTGPTLIVPCAIAFKIFGKNDVLPGLTAIFIWGSVLTLVLARISRRIDGLSFLLGVSVMCAAFLASFSFHFELWSSFFWRNCCRCLPYLRTLAHIKRAIRGDVVISVRSRSWVRVPVEVYRRNPRDGHCPSVCCERHAC